MEQKQQVVQMSPALRQALQEWVRKQTDIEAGVPRLFPHLPSWRVSVSTLEGLPIRNGTRLSGW